MITPGQKERFLFGGRVLMFPVEVHVRECPSGTSVGVSHGSGRNLSAVSSFNVEMRRRNQGA
jgi:hypothetical protein